MRFKYSVALSLIVWPSWVGAANRDVQIADAVKERDHAVVLRLLKRGVDVNAPQMDGTTALHWAAHWGDLDTVQVLLRAGANADATTRYGVTPLSLACESGRTRIIEMLLKAGANPNV